MGLRLDDKWVWDFWFARAGEEHHVFYLQAPRALGDPDLRHRHATVGHAVSTDLTHWRVLPDALHPGEPGAWDDVAIWTGSVLAHEGRWYMLYTGTGNADEGLVQRIGLAVSDDLVSWSKHPANPVIEADARWYETLDRSRWRDQSWRDPWLFTTAQDDYVHVYITARTPAGEPDGAGVVAHARSRDLVSWEVGPPVTDGGEFAQVEVPQLVALNGGYSLLISCLEEDHSRRRRARPEVIPRSGTYIFSGPSEFGPFSAGPGPLVLDDHGTQTLYAGKLVEVAPGELRFMAFRGDGAEGFAGELTDPLPVSLLPEHGLAVQDAQRSRAPVKVEIAPEIRDLIEWGTQVSERYGELPLERLRVELAREHDQEMRRLGMRLEAGVSFADHTLAVPGGEIRVRLFVPDSQGPHPLFLHLHGGGFVFGSIDSVVNDAKCSRIARRARCAVATVDYRLAPEARFPTAAEDCYAALEFLASEAPRLGLDVARMAVGGESAGGNLAAVVAMMARDRRGPKLVAQLLEVPVTDISSSGADYPSVAQFAAGYGLDATDMDTYSEQYLGAGGDGGDPYASPLLAQDLSGLPAAHVLTAEFDVLRDSGELYARRLLAAGVSVSATRMLGHTHGSAVLWPVWEPAERWMRTVEGALRTVLHPHERTRREHGIA